MTIDPTKEKLFYNRPGDSVRCVVEVERDEYGKFKKIQCPMNPSRYWEFSIDEHSLLGKCGEPYCGRTLQFFREPVRPETPPESEVKASEIKESTRAQASKTGKKNNKAKTSKPIPLPIESESERKESPSLAPSHLADLRKKGLNDDTERETCESNLTEGAFIISRSIDHSEVWFKDHIYLKTWVWILRKANHQEVKEGNFVYHRGEFYTTYDELRESLAIYRKHKKVKPSPKQIRRILEWFIGNEMIEKTPVTKPQKLTTTSPLPHQQGVFGADHKLNKRADQKAERRAYLGLKIKIINFDTYQNLDNYRGRPKGRDKGRRKNVVKGRPWGRGRAEVGHDNNNDNNEKNKRTFVEGSTELRLASFLLEEILKNKPDFRQPNLQTWARDVDLMLRIDKRSAETIERVIRWAQSDHGDGTGKWEGWAAVILSTRNLRDNFDKIELKMQRTSKQAESEPRARQL